MELHQWSYTRRYQIKAIFSSFPDAVVLFRKIGDYYFIFSISGLEKNHLPGRKEYVQMEYLLNKEMGTLPTYIERRRKNSSSAYL